MTRFEQLTKTFAEPALARQLGIRQYRLHSIIKGTEKTSPVINILSNAFTYNPELVEEETSFQVFAQKVQERLEIRKKKYYIGKRAEDILKTKTQLQTFYAILLGVSLATIKRWEVKDDCKDSYRKLMKLCLDLIESSNTGLWIYSKIVLQTYEEEGITDKNVIWQYQWTSKLKNNDL